MMNLCHSMACNVRAWRSAGNSIRSAGTVVDFLFEVQDKFFCSIELRRPDNCSLIAKQKSMLRFVKPAFCQALLAEVYLIYLL